MIIPTFNDLKNLFKLTVNRFTPAIILSLTSAILMVVVIGSNDSSFGWFYGRISLVLIAAFAISVIARLFLESKDLVQAQTKNFLIPYFAPLLAIPFFFLFPDQPGLSDQQDFINILIVYFILFILIFLAPFISLNKKFVEKFADDNFHFWRFTNSLILGLILTGFFNGILITGFYIILFALNILLKIEIDYKIFAQISFGFSFSFFPIFWLYCIPKEFHNLPENDFKFPIFYKILGNFILIPLWSLFNLILLIYTGQILFSGQWPTGQVVPLLLFSFFSGAFIVLITLVQKGLFINIFQKVFFAVCLVLSIVYFLAINLRLEYGLTENRYFIILLGIFFVLISLVGLYKVNLKFYAIIMIFLAIFTTLPVVGMFDLSISSQQNRFEKLLSDNQILVNGKLTKLTKSLDAKTEYEISSSLNYLVERKQNTYLKKYFSNQNLNSDEYNYQTSQELANEMGVEYRSYYGDYYEKGFPDEYPKYGNLYNSQTSGNSTSFNIANYTKFIMINSGNQVISANQMEVTVDSFVLQIPILNDQNRSMFVENANDSKNAVELTFAGKLDKKSGNTTGNFTEYKFIASQINYQIQEDQTIQIQYAEGSLFLK